MAKQRRGKRTPRGGAQPAEATPAPANSGARWSGALIFAIATLLYANTWGHDFVLDDRLAITDNRFTQSGFAGIADLLRTDSFEGAIGNETNLVAGGRYRPLSLITFAIEIGLFGENARVSHIVNSLLYGGCCLLLYAVLAQWLGPRDPPLGASATAFAAALLFAVHPLHVEAVANIKGRDEILALAGCLGALLLLWRAIETRSRAAAGGAGAVFFAALLSKENAITFVAVVPAALWFFRGSLREHRQELAPMGAAAVGFLLIRASVVASSNASPELLNDPFLGATPSETWGTVFASHARAYALLVWPHPLTHEYGPFHIAWVGWTHPLALAGLALDVALAGLAVIGWRRRWVLSFASFYLLATFSIVSNVVFSIGTFLGERFLFMPSVGVCLAAAWGLAAGASRFVPPALQTRAAMVACSIVALAFAGLTVQRNAAWQDPFTLHTTDVVTSEGSAHAQQAAADVWFARAKDSAKPSERAEATRNAVDHAERALAIYPEYRLAWRLRASLARELEDDIDGAIAALTRLHDLQPSGPNVAYNLGTLILQHRPARRAEAIPYLESAVALAPNDADAYGNLGAARYFTGSLDAAIDAYVRAATLAPGRRDFQETLRSLREEAAATAP